MEDRREIGGGEGRLACATGLQVEEAERKRKKERERTGEKTTGERKKRDEWKRRCLDGIYCSRRKYSKRVASTLLDNRKWKPAPRWFI